MTSQLPSPWQRLFTQLAAPAPAARLPVPPPSLAAGPSLGGSAPSWQAAHPSGWRGGGAPGAAPPPPPKPPVDQRPLPSEPPRRALELAWLTWQMPEPMREAAILNLRQTLDWRAQYCKPLDTPETPPEYTRFGLLGEQLQPNGALTVYKTLRAELREIIRTVGGEQSRTERNRRLAMHSIRLGQLCAELEQRGIDALEKLRLGLTWLWN